MIDNGFRFYKGEDGALLIDQLVDGSVYPLESLPEDQDKPLGYYDVNWKFLNDDEVQRAAPRTLYVHRNLLNAEDVIDWFKGQGFTTTLPSEDMHVTVAFSKAEMDWPEPLTLPIIVSGGAREMLAFGDDEPLARVMAFDAPVLHDRWQEIKDAGASWDWPEYQPHVTISYTGAPNDLDRVEPYPGSLIFGPEIFAEIDEGWKDQIVEREFDEAEHPRDEDVSCARGRE